VKNLKFIYINCDKAIEIHDYIVDSEGGLVGIKDKGQLESILEHIKNDTYYPDVFDKVTHLVYGIVKYHVFNDGNKRTALAVGAFFLGLNYSKALSEKFIVEMENVVVDVASGKIEKQLLKEIITAIFFENEKDEELLFKIYKALQK
jgi:death on curing protein